ncbi:unnamed protein product [Cylicocyclus nassatus]|uniref:Tyrosine-protein kinase n=1 Tax=Cylicocyclus nassatus TaxID=53992 RepID=A0AA36DW83_CYLNA|nr:unnamed protein product [Cylicocyclus nassatus]
MEMLTNKADDVRPLSDQRTANKNLLSEYTYYHGMVPPQDVPELLEKDGDFLLRKEQVKKGLLIAVLSVRCDDVVKHFIINKSDKGEYYIENLRAKTIEDLVQSHLKSGEPLSKASQARLKRAVPRQEWMLNHEDIIFRECVGQRNPDSVEEYVGEFVYNNVTRPVFLKTVGITCSRNVRARVMKEARLLRSLRHPNVGEIYGVALHYSPIILVLEYFSKSLHTHLKQNAGQISEEDRRRFITEAAAGFAYLAENGCIHRDISAKICKLSDALEVKISGFSLCENTKEMHESNNIQIAVKWQAPEVLKGGNFSLKSDVWSFGILMWEVYNDGAEPYAGMTPSVVKSMILEDDYKMPVPQASLQLNGNQEKA